METNQEAKIAFEKIIEHGRTQTIRKSAEKYWAAFNSDEGANEEVSNDFEQAIRSIPLDYRQPTVPYLDELKTCKDSSDDVSSCYLHFAIRIVDRIVSKI